MVYNWFIETDLSHLKLFESLDLCLLLNVKAAEEKLKVR